MPATQSPVDPNDSPAQKPGCFAKVFPCFAPSSHKEQDLHASASREVAVHADLVRQNQNVTPAPLDPEKPSFVPEQPSVGPLGGKEPLDFPEAEKPKATLATAEAGENGARPEQADSSPAMRERPRIEDDGDAATTQSSNTNLSPPTGPGAGNGAADFANSSTSSGIAAAPAEPATSEIAPAPSAEPANPPAENKPPPHPNRTEQAVAPPAARSLGFFQGPPLPLEKAAPAADAAQQPRALPVSHSPFQSPFQSPRMPLFEGAAEGEDAAQDLGRVLTLDGEAVDARVIEREIEDIVDAIHYCMIVSHPTSDELGCLLTLRAAAGSAGLALDHAGLQLASKSGSEAATVMSARQCALFRRGLALELEYVNKRIARHRVQVRRFQVLREDFSAANGMLERLSGEVRRDMVQRRYRHIINDMYHHEARYPHRWMQEEGRAHGQAPRQGGSERGSPSGQGGEAARRRELEEVALQLHELDQQVARQLQMLDGKPAPGQGREGSLTELGHPFSLDGAQGAPGRRFGQAAQTGASPRRPLPSIPAGDGGPSLDDVLSQYQEQNGTATPRFNTPPRQRGGGAGAGFSPQQQRGATPRSPRGGGGGYEGAGGGGGDGAWGSGRARSPRASPGQGQGQRLPGSGRGAGSGQTTPRDRGRYSPSFSYTNVAPYDGSKAREGGGAGGPVGVGLMGLPVGGASLQGLVEGCMPANPGGGGQAGIRGRPPRPYAHVQGAGRGMEGQGAAETQPWAAPGQQGRNAMRGASPASPAKGRPGESGTEWAF